MPFPMRGRHHAVRSAPVLWKVMEQSHRNLAEAVEDVVTPEEVLLGRS